MRQSKRRQKKGQKETGEEAAAGIQAREPGKALVEEEPVVVAAGAVAVAVVAAGAVAATLWAREAIAFVLPAEKRLPM